MRIEPATKAGDTKPGDRSPGYAEQLRRHQLAVLAAFLSPSGGVFSS